MHEIKLLGSNSLIGLFATLFIEHGEGEDFATFMRGRTGSTVKLPLPFSPHPSLNKEVLNQTIRFAQMYNIKLEFL